MLVVMQATPFAPPVFKLHHPNLALSQLLQIGSQTSVSVDYSDICDR
jgi:hypothetical protein